MDLSYIDQREQSLLKSLIELYTVDGQPVSSSKLAKYSELNFSASTIRNIMSALEDKGLIFSPHISAGRIPTSQGYRLFVDSLIELKPINRQIEQSVKQQMNFENSNNAIVSVIKTLANTTLLTGVAMLDFTSSVVLQQIEFMSLSDYRILAVLILQDDKIENRILTTEQSYTQSELEQVSNYLNQHYTGLNLAIIRHRLLADLQKIRTELDDIMVTIIQQAAQSLDISNVMRELYVDGQENLMNAEDLSDVNKLRQLFEKFQQKQDILHILDRCQDADDVHIFIGQESVSDAGHIDVLADCSVVAAPHYIDGSIAVIGVIGPKRMQYERIIPIVSMTSRLCADTTVLQ